MASAAPTEEREEVVVVGGGVIGASIAYHLTQRGLKPLILERTAVGCAASGKAGGFLARGWGDGGPTEALHRLGFDLHERLATTLGLRSFRRIPTLQVRTRPGGSAKATRMVPWLDGSEVASSSLMDSDTAQVTPMELTTALVDAAVAAGARVRIGTVGGVQRGADGAVQSVLVDGAPLPCKKVIFAMGPWSVLAGDWLGVQVPLEGIRSASVIYRGDAVQAALAADPAALFCGEDARHGTHLEVYPRNNGELYVCGIGGSDYVRGARLRPGGDTESQEKVHADPGRVAAARAAMAGMTSLAAGEPAVAQACMRPCAPDALPIMGAVPGCPNAFLAAGHNCWGILWSLVSGLAMAELAATGDCRAVDLAPFSPARFNERALAGRGRKQGATPVGEQW